MAHQQHLLAGMSFDQIKPGFTHPGEKIFQRLRARRALLERIAFEPLYHLRIIDAQLRRGLAFPHAEPYFHEAFVETQGEIFLACQFDRESLAAC